MNQPPQVWLGATLESIASHRRMIDAVIDQLSDDELRTSPQAGVNSVAVLLRHLGGNLQSRWTEFLDTDGEKPTRSRESEFEPWDGDRASLLQYFDTGWQCLVQTITSLSSEDLERVVTIRGESHTVPLAIMRSLSHIAYHTGQMMLVARTVHHGPWNWLTIAPGGSESHNRKTWGTSWSRGVAGGGGQDNR